MSIAKYLDPARNTRRWITIGLTTGGALAGAVVGLVLTVLGKIVSGAPPAETANYIWNATIFGMIGAFAAPLVTWSALRSVPLWRTIAEPLAGSVVGAGIGVLIGSGVGFLVLTPLGAAAAVARLQYSHRTLAKRDRP